MKAQYVLILFFLQCYIVLFSQEHIPDPNTSLLLHFNGDAKGASGEIPSIDSGLTYESGIFSQAAATTDNSELRYQANGNILSTEGTVEAWIKPDWNGDDSGDHTLLSWGSAGGLLIMKDGGNYFKMIVNRVGTDPVGPEAGVGFRAVNWVGGQWHHVACTWSTGLLELYIDGVLVNSSTFSFTPPLINSADFFIGSDNSNNEWDGLIEELRISNVVRSSTEILQSYTNGLSVTDISFKENNICIYPSWRYKPEMCITIDNSDTPVPAMSSSFNWTSSNPAVAIVDSNGDVQALQAGNVTLTASQNGVSEDLLLTVKAPVRQPETITVDPAMAKPMDCSKELMRVVIVNYFPTIDGVNIDQNETGPIPGQIPMPIEELDNTVYSYNIHMKHMLEERTKFRGYKDSNAEPYLGYEVVEYINVYEPMPRYIKLGGPASTWHLDYWVINERFNMQDFVDNQDVDEIWIWGYHTDEIAGWESNMSSPTTGDISNSNRDNTDLQVYSQTYMAYWFNYTRTPNLHNQGHQLESIFSYINAPFFWEKFVGSLNGNAPIGRCGDTHHPPNTTEDYDYKNDTLVESDIEDWLPDGGITKMINVNTWGALSYNWPYGVIPPAETEVNYYIYWMQSMPGYQNGIPYQSDFLTNWWEFIADWDTASQTLGLYENSPSPPTTHMVGACPHCRQNLNIQPIAFNGEYKVYNDIYSDALVNPQDDVTFRAENNINLTVGFEVGLKTVFEAYIDVCN